MDQFIGKKEKKRHGLGCISFFTCRVVGRAKSCWEMCLAQGVTRNKWNYRLIQSHSLQE